MRTGRHVVDLDEPQHAIAQMASFEARLQAALEDVDRRVTALHHTWSGQAATAHRAAHQEWLDGSRRMRHALASMRRIATTAHGNYTDAVSANVRMWG